MPDLNGIDATRRIRALRGNTGVVGLSASVDRTLAREIFEAGASAYVGKNSAFSELVHAIRAVAAGRQYLSSVMRTLFEGAPPTRLGRLADISEERRCPFSRHGVSTARADL